MNVSCHISEIEFARHYKLQKKRDGIIKAKVKSWVIYQGTWAKRGPTQLKMIKSGQQLTHG